MRIDRRWRLAVAGAAVVALVVALALVVTAGSDDGVTSAGIGASSSTSASAGEDAGTTPTSAAALTTTTSSSSSSSTTAPRLPPATTATPATPATAPARCIHPAPGSDFDGFGATEIVIQNSEGTHRSCVLTADTPDQQRQGLMRQDDLDGYEGMIFRFPTAEERAFWMRNTRIPLSIAYFDGGGAFVSATDMAPCGDSPDCPNYPSRGPAKFALEVAQGRLPAVGATAGSRLAAA